VALGINPKEDTKQATLASGLRLSLPAPEERDGLRRLLW
jgi:hypothetical protein